MVKKIAVTGGKGGTGKSTVAVLIAKGLQQQGSKVVLCDCDVECPNDYLLTGVELKDPEKKVFGEFPKLIKEKCKKCGKCAKTCRSNAIFWVPGEYPRFIPDLCTGCGACWAVCPFGAIKPQQKEVGEIYVNQVSGIRLITGMARPGLEETGPVVGKVKDFAIDFAQEIGADYILFDTAAGTHCPVINALLGADQVYAVTEPTPMGSYDLNLILDLTQKLEAPVEIILNQSDLGDKRRTEEISREKEINIVKEIPYSSKIARAYSRGKLLDLPGLKLKI